MKVWNEYTILNYISQLFSVTTGQFNKNAFNWL